MRLDWQGVVAFLVLLALPGFFVGAIASIWLGPIAMLWGAVSLPAFVLALTVLIIAIAYFRGWGK